MTEPTMDPIVHNPAIWAESEMMYLVVFLSALIVDLIPVIAPPAWTIMVFLLVEFHLNPWIVLIVGVTGSAIGRYIFSLYVPHIGDKLIKRGKKDDLEFIGGKLAQTLWQSWLIVFLYTLTPSPPPPSSRLRPSPK